MSRRNERFGNSSSVNINTVEVIDKRAETHRKNTSKSKQDGRLYNQVTPVALGHRRKINPPSNSRSNPMNEQEKTSLLKRIISNNNEQNPSGLREFVLGCFQLAEQRKLDVPAQTVLVQELKDVISKAYVEKKEFVNDWWSQTIPALSKKSPKLELVCDANNLRGSSPQSGSNLDTRGSDQFAPPPPPPPVGLPVIPPPPPTGAPSVGQHFSQTSQLPSSHNGMIEPSVIGYQKDHQKRKGVKGIKVDSKEAERRRKRMERFSDATSNPKKSKSVTDENFANLNAISTNFYKFDKNKPVVGRCQILEKKYLRLTSEPNPELVRPLNILKRAFDIVVQKYEKEEASYQYLCDQFKSIRQDLRVQIIENKFTLKVFQTHARIALENGDIGEFNQCQSRLKQLFELPTIKKSNLEEFLSYRVLYYLMMNNHDSINELKLKYMAPDNLSIYRHPVVQHSLQMARSLLIGDYHNFFKLYEETSGPTRCLLDTFIERERVRALNTICQSYNQISLTFLFKELRFANQEEGTNFLERFELIKYTTAKQQTDTIEHEYLNTKASRYLIMQQFEKSRKVDIKGQL